MNNLGSFHRRWRLEVAFVLLPFAALIVLQYVSNSRLARVEVIAHQTTLMRYLDAVTAHVRRVYEDAAEMMLDVPGDALVAERFDSIARHFDGVDTSAARLLFAGLLDGCVCETRYYNPDTGDISIEADRSTKAVALRVSTLLRLEQMLDMDPSETYVDERDAENRVLYRFVLDGEENTVGFVGFVIDEHRFEREYLPQTLSEAARHLSDDMRDNLIVRVRNDAGDVVVATHDELGQGDVLTGRFDFAFRGWQVSAQNRHTAAAQVLQGRALTNTVLSALMSLMAIGGVLLTWRAARRERQLARIRSGFVASVSHELRTPLASIAIFSDHLRCGRVTASRKVVEYGRRIDQEAARLGHLIDNVLSFGRIESGERHYCRESAAIEDVIDAAVAVVELRRSQGGFTITVDTPSVRLPEICIDATAMTQVFVNLLDNAMKYSGRCRRIRVALRRSDEAVTVAVTDAGIGIARDQQRRIFDEFYRVSAGVSGGVAGTGLGLAIVRHVVRAHDGQVEVDSRLGQGATFTVVLPLTSRVVPRSVDVPTVVDHSELEARA